MNTFANLVPTLVVVKLTLSRRRHSNNVACLDKTSNKDDRVVGAIDNSPSQQFDTYDIVQGDQFSQSRQCRWTFKIKGTFEKDNRKLLSLLLLLLLLMWFWFLLGLSFGCSCGSAVLFHFLLHSFFGLVFTIIILLLFFFYYLFFFFFSVMKQSSPKIVSPRAGCWATVRPAQPYEKLNWT